MRRVAPFALLLALLAPAARGEQPAAAATPASSLPAAPDAGVPPSALGPALRAIERGHYATAMRALRRPAQQGDPLAQNNLGYLYEHGLGVVRSDADALAWYARAAESGLPVAQFNLATMYLRGKGIPPDAKAAVKWFSAAAASGHAGAEYMTGECYRSGTGVPRDEAEAYRLFRYCAESAPIPNTEDITTIRTRCRFNLATMIEQGWGVDANPAQAKALREYATNTYNQAAGTRLSIEKLEQRIQP